MKIERLLVRGVNWLGDAVMTTPALLRLRETFPETHITLLTPAKLADLWQRHPAVDAVSAFPAGASVFAVARLVRAVRAEVALVLPNSPRSALEVFLGGVPARVGYARPWRNAFLTRRVALPPEFVAMRKRSAGEVKELVAGGDKAAPSIIPTRAHQMFHYLHLVAALGASAGPLTPRLCVLEDEIAAMRGRFGLPVSGARPRLLGLNAGAEYGPAKRWPKERFVAAAARVQRDTGCHVWVLGGPGDVELARWITGELERASAGPPGSVRCLAGATTLRELCAALAACDVVLTNDTGPMHIAAAVGARVVVPFGSTSPGLTAPGLPGRTEHALLRTEVPCAPCFLRECPIDLRCMTGISVEQVVAAVETNLGPR